MKLKYFFSFEFLPTLLIFGYFIYVFYAGFHNYKNDYSILNIPQSDTAFGGIFADIKIDESLPYYQYNRLNGIAKSFKEYRKDVNENFFGDGWSFGYFGVSSSNRFETNSNEFYTEIKKSIKQIDSIMKIKNEVRDINKYLFFTYHIDTILFKLEELNNNNNRLEHEKINETKYFFSLGNYKLRDENSKFYIENGQNYLAFVKWDSSKLNNSFLDKYGHYERKKINIRYTLKDKRVIIPISKFTYSIINFILLAIMFMLVVLSLSVTFWLPYKILVNISRGKVFIQQNIDYLKFMIKTYIALLIVFLVIPYLIKIFLINMIPNEFVLDSIFETISNDFSFIIYIVVLYFILKAFKKGYQLQNESSLTI